MISIPADAANRIGSRTNFNYPDLLKNLSNPATAKKKIVSSLTRAPANDAPLGGLKVVSEHGWFAARPSGTEDIYKIYAESFRDAQHLQRIIKEARDIVTDALV